MSARVLVIDDEPMFQDLTRSVLSIAQHRVDAAANGFEALKLLGQCEFDVVIVDYHLPEMDGYALARLLVEHTRYRQRPPVLIAVTADPDGLAVRRGSDSIFTCILAKPVAPRQLLLVIDLALRQREGVGDLGPVATALVMNPDARTAADASRAFWREAGLPDRPRAIVLPPPTRDQATALSICFDLCGDPEDSDLLITTDPAALAEHAARLGPAATRLPVVGVNRIEAPVLDLEFTLSDRDCWRRVAKLVGDFDGRRRQLVDAVKLSSAVEDRLLSYMFMHQKTWQDGCVVLLSPRWTEQTLSAAASALMAVGWLQHATMVSDAFELSSAGVDRVTGQRTESLSAPATGPEKSSVATRDRASAVSVGSPDACRILVFETDDFARDVIGSVLDEAGYMVSACVSAADLVAGLDGHLNEIVLLPVESWPPVLGPATALTSRRGTPQSQAVIAMIPDGAPFADAMLASGCVQGVLSRPVRPRPLLDLMAKLASETTAAVPAFDDAVFEELLDLVGASSVARLIDKLAAQLRGRFADGPYGDDGGDALRADAHGMRGSAGMLGFAHLSELCGRLERACEARQGARAALVHVLAARTEALAHLAALAARADLIPGAAA